MPDPAYNSNSKFIKLVINKTLLNCDTKLEILLRVDITSKDVSVLLIN